MRLLLLLQLALALMACSGPEGDRPATLEELRGQWVVINYWAQWCKPCITEIPELNALDQQDDHISVFGVNYDGASGEALATQVQALGVKFPTLSEDPSAQLGIPRPAVLPTTLILNPEGQLVTTLLGPQTQESLTAITLGAIGDKES